MPDKPKDLGLPPDHPMIVAGFIHELHVLDAWGFTWSTWCKDYRTRMPGITTPSGRWFHRNQLVEWWGVMVNK